MAPVARPGNIDVAVREGTGFSRHVKVKLALFISHSTAEARNGVDCATGVMYVHLSLAVSRTKKAAMTERGHTVQCRRRVSSQH